MTMDEIMLDVDGVSVDDCVNVGDTIDLSDKTGMEMTRNIDATSAVQANVTARAYQLEMLDASLKENIIVAMDTGSGKTQIAVLRILEEIENGDPNKTIWFLAPTVALCSQQFAVLERQIQAVQIRFLSGADNVDRWSDQSIWDAALHNVRIIVCTPAILRDALTHGFVKLAAISLLIFDEAHNVVGDNPAAQIMRSFYQHSLASQLAVPKILGLSASPVMNSKLASLNNIEATLDARCRTPTLNRSELLSFVNMPELRPVQYVAMGIPPTPAAPSVMGSLLTVIQHLDIEDDPWVIHLRQQDDDDSKLALRKCLIKQKSSSRDQLTSFRKKAETVYMELGHWAADFYITESIRRFVDKLNDSPTYLDDLERQERAYVCKILQLVNTALFDAVPEIQNDEIRDKVVQLIQSIPKDDSLLGIVFVKERVVTAVLRILLAKHSSTRHLRIGSVMGNSVDTTRKKKNELINIIQIDDQQDTLADFRSGQLDLVISTSVMEEGIDVPACNFVLCFDMPANLKSFIQRRGRARQQQSTLVIMSPSASIVSTWQTLEAQMKEMYADTERQIKALAELDANEEMDNRSLRIQSTGALLTLDNAVSHLGHFCAVIPHGPYVNSQPVYIPLAPNDGFDNLRCPVHTVVRLPMSIDVSLRKHTSLNAWVSPINGKKDAAYQAFVALYNAGLVDDHLMPLMQLEEDVAQSRDVETTPSMKTVRILHDPWIEIVKAWASEDFERLTFHTLRLSNGTSDSSRIVAISTAVPCISGVPLYLDEGTTLNLALSVDQSEVSDPRTLEKLQSSTHALLDAVFGHRFHIEAQDYLVLFGTTDNVSSLPRDERSRSMLTQPRLTDVTSSDLYVIRDPQGVPFLCQQWFDKKPQHLPKELFRTQYEPLLDEMPYLALKKLTRKEDYLYKPKRDSNQSTTSSGERCDLVLPVSQCTQDSISKCDMEFALLIPSVMHVIGTYLIAGKLCETILASVGELPLDIIITALTTSSASSTNNYQRLEFLGDSVLKLCTSLQLLGEHPLWHEGYLSRAKDHIVSNARLARAAITTGIDEFIITEKYAGRKWRPRYTHSILALADTDAIPETCQISSKILADVVESLIGAATVVGDVPASLQCMAVFLPEIHWVSLDERRASLYSTAPADIHLPDHLKPVEKLLGYCFKKSSLLVESLTHASCNAGMTTCSYERLEYLGDAILDYIVTRKMFASIPTLSHDQMHHVRSAFVNADFLAYICLSTTYAQESSRVEETSSSAVPSATFEKVIDTVELPLWKFMRHSSSSVAASQRETAARFARHRAALLDTFENGINHPWWLLAHLQAPKFLSDIVEAILGAVYIDSGSFEVVKEVMKTLGIMKHLDRALTNRDIDLWHPKEELGVCAANESVKYVIKNERVVTESMEKWAWWCEVFVGERLVCRADGGVSAEEIKTKAATEAVRLLRSEQSSI